MQWIPDVAVRLFTDDVQVVGLGIELCDMRGDFLYLSVLLQGPLHGSFDGLRRLLGMHHGGYDDAVVFDDVKHDIGQD